MLSVVGQMKLISVTMASGNMNYILCYEWEGEQQLAAEPMTMDLIRSGIKLIFVSVKGHLRSPMVTLYKA